MEDITPKIIEDKFALKKRLEIQRAIVCTAVLLSSPIAAWAVYFATRSIEPAFLGIAIAAAVLISDLAAAGILWIVLSRKIDSVEF